MCVQLGQVGVTRLLLDLFGVLRRAHERVEVAGQAANGTASDQLPETVDRERDVHVLHERRAVEAGARVTLEDVSCWCVGRNHSVGLLPDGKGIVTPQVEARSRHQRQLGHRQRPAQRRRRCVVVIEARKVNQALPSGLRQLFQSRHVVGPP